MSFRLLITEGKGAGKEFTFSQSSVKVGRLPDNDLVLYDMGVSRYHCEISADGDSFTLRDTGSANGTVLNETLTTEARIKPGDKIQIGPVCFIFEPDVGHGAAAGESQRGEMFRPTDEAKRRALEEQATRAFAREEFEAERGIRDPAPAANGLARASAASKTTRTDTGSFASYARARAKAQGMPRSTRLAILVAAGAIIAGGGTSIYLLENRPQKDRSPEIFRADRANAALKFGAGKVDIHTPDRVNFQFDYGGGRSTLFYAAGGIETPNELEILLNGKHVEFVQLSPGRWTTGLKISLPRTLLESGVNILTFDNTLTPAKDERWGVAQVVVEEKKLPKPDEKKARELFKLGQAAYETRSVTPQNLHRSIEYYDDARQYLEALERAPALLKEIEEARQRSVDELQDLYDSYLFAAEKDLRFGNRQEAADTLRELLRYLPDTEDLRHKQAKRRLTDLLGRREP